MDYSRKLTEILAAVGVRVTPHREESVPDFTGVNEEKTSVSERTPRSGAGNEKLDTQWATPKNDILPERESVCRRVPVRKFVSSTPNFSGEILVDEEKRKERRPSV